MRNLQEAIDKIRETGTEVRNNGFMLCYFHDEQKPSARLWHNSYHSQIEYHCFSCGVSYKFETFYKAITNKEYKQKIRERIPYIDLNLLSSRLNAYFLTLLDREFEDPRYGEVRSFTKEAKRYLKERGLDIEAIKKYEIGFVMRADTEKLEGIKDNGWTKDKSRYCFLTFPIRNQKGNIVTTQFEDFMNKDKRDDTKLNLRGKPLSLWCSQTPNQENKENEEWVVCEAIYDAISFDLAGVKAIALLGQPSTKQIEELKEFKHLLLALDNDEGGKRTKNRLAKELYPIVALREVTYPEGIKDPNELLQKKGIDGIMGLMEKAQAIDLFPPLIDTIDVMIKDYLKLKEQAIQIPEEFSFFKKFLPNGLLPGLYALAGIPGIGKTTILNQLADSLAKNKIPTIYFLTEEPAYRLIMRTTKKEGLEHMQELKANQFNILLYRRIFEMIPDYIAEKLKDIIQGIKFGLEMEGKHYPVFILDSLQALRLSKENERLDIRAKSILKTELLSHIARDLSIPVLFTSFMAREYYPGKKSKNKPTMAIFKESGDIEYLIDAGMCLWVKKEGDLEENEPEVELHFVKNRFGKQGKEDLIFKKSECRFD